MNPSSPLVTGLPAGSVPRMPFPVGVASDGIALIRDHLPAWARGATIPDTFVFRPTRTAGVALAPTLAEDPATGSVAVPIYQRRGSRYGEHLHGGEEKAIMLSGVLQDARGRYQTTADYGQLPWTLHTPESVGEEAAVFIGIAHGGVLLTSLHGTLGADLLAAHQIDRTFLERLFANIPPDSAQPAPTRAPLFEYMLQILLDVDDAGKGRLPAGYDTYWTGNGREWILRLAALDATARVAYARQWLSADRPRR